MKRQRRASGDRLGQRRVLKRIVVWWSAFTAATAAAANFAQLILTQLLFGAGEAGAYPNASGVIARWFPTSERARAQGAVWAASRVGGALSPLLVVPLLRAIGWRGMFCVFASLALLWAWLWRPWFHDRPGDQPGISAAELAEIGPASPQTHAGGVWSGLLHSRQTWLLMAMYWCYVWGSWFYFSWFPTFLVRGAGFTEKQMGLLSALPFLLGCGGNLAGGVLSDRLLVMILSPLGFGVLDLMLPAAWSLCLDLGRAHAGVLTATMNTAGLAGGFVCTVLFGYLVRATGGYRAPLCLVAAMVMLSAILFALIDPRRPVWKEPEVH